MSGLEANVEVKREIVATRGRPSKKAAAIDLQSDKGGK
jgi:hypothetical protein